MKTFNFKYNCTITRQGKDIKVVGYNSPYDSRKSQQSIDDIKYAVLEQKIINLKDLPKDKRIDVHFVCRFIENDDGTYNQIFSLK